MIFYEQPLNERIRTFLRLDFLFSQAKNSLDNTSVWDTRATIESIIDIQNIFNRIDMKLEVLKELERHSASLTRLENNPNINKNRLNSILDQIDSFVDQLHAVDGQIGHKLRENEFINSIKQRISTPGGTCDFDLPAYHFWLQQPVDIRIQNLRKWINEFEIVNSAIQLLLLLTRESAPPRKSVAESGFFQSSLDTNLPYQIIRVGVPDSSPYYAEISAGKHRFTIRFVKPSAANGERPVQAGSDVDFELTCCVI